ncbi:hypothetical protein AYO20_01527 [Fonsecaea nubica]|uniref:Uncharacterized protein n=1 Tax=Fonsecaea nubica TaxID=856822 RepID=A0A178DAM0_9EURO|nr:hypothetical protein AYO20_01527 [Fonsecaea nubica]OAL39209.1 hypothetical protein AYO20_01527 [Fonsecaea nubica]
MPTNIPTRSLSPIKTNSSLLPDASSAATTGKAPRKIQLDAKEPTRLEPPPACLRATNEASDGLRSDPSKPRGSRIATKTSTVSAAARASRLVPGHSRSQSSSSATIIRPTSSAPKVATATASSRSQHSISTKSSGDTRLPVSKSHNRALSASAPPRPNPDTGTSREVVSKVGPHVFAGGNVSSSSARPTARLGKKPDFNAHQQHYSPKKPTTISTSVVPVLPSDPQHVAGRSGSIARAIPGTEVARQEDELLQLSLVYDKSAATFQHYEASIKSQLQTGSERVKHQLSTLRSLCHDRQAKINAFAVRRWLDQEPSRQDVEHAGSDTLLLLAGCLEELHEVSGQDGPLEAVMMTFEDWYLDASSRRPTNVTDNLFRESNNEEKAYCPHPIDPQWSALVSAVDDRVRACAALLAGLRVHGSPGPSSLETLIEMHHTLAEQILQEICICRAIEGFMLREQQERLASEVQQALSDVELHPSVELIPDTARKGIWNLRGKVS